MKEMKPLDGETVLDFTQSVAGPVCTQMLAEQGATVIKVEPPNGDTFRNIKQGTMFTPFNHGKESICVDLKKEEGRKIALELVKKSDIVVESFRPGVIDKFGLDYDTIADHNSELIYCSLSGFGQSGPYSEYPGYDPAIQAMCGLMATTGYPDRPPVRIRSSLIDCGTGTNAAFAIMSALRERDKTGDGAYIDISLFDVAVSWMSYWIASYSQTGDLPERDGQLGIGTAPNGVFQAKEGHIYVCTMSDKMYERLCLSIDSEELLNDERFTTNEKRLENRSDLRNDLNDEFQKYEKIELERILLEANVPCGAVRTVKDVLESHPQVEYRSMIEQTYNPETESPVSVSALPYRFDGKNETQFSEKPPIKGEDTVDILEKLLISDEEIIDLINKGVVY